MAVEYFTHLRYGDLVFAVGKIEGHHLKTIQTVSLRLSETVIRIFTIDGIILHVPATHVKLCPDSRVPDFGAQADSGPIEV